MGMVAETKLAKHRIDRLEYGIVLIMTSRKAWGISGSEPSGRLPDAYQTP